MLTNLRIAFIGAGNMAASLIGGLIKTGYPAQQIWAANPGVEKLQSLHQRFGINITQNNLEAVQQADIVVLAVKPQVLAIAANAIAPAVQERNPLVISIAAGISLQCLQQWLGNAVSIVRCMPNMPALVGCGATGMYADSAVPQMQRQQAQTLMEAVGIAVWLEEEAWLDIVTALSGSGPAYFFLMMEALVDAAVSLGLPAELAQVLAVHTALGSARMAEQNKARLPLLRQQVTSPGGTTEQALNVLESGGIRQLLAAALNAAKQKSAELTQLMR